MTVHDHLERIKAAQAAGETYSVEQARIELDTCAKDTKLQATAGAIVVNNCLRLILGTLNVMQSIKSDSEECAAIVHQMTKGVVK